MDWLDLLAVQGTLKSLLQHHSSKASILQRSAFFKTLKVDAIKCYSQYVSKSGRPSSRHRTGKGQSSQFSRKVVLKNVQTIRQLHSSPILVSSFQFSSVTQSCPTLCNPMNHSTPGLPVHHQLPEFTQTHVHRVSDAIQPSHPRSSPSPPAPNPSQHHSLFQ